MEYFAPNVQITQTWNDKFDDIIIIAEDDEEAHKKYGARPTGASKIYSESQFQKVRN